MKRILLAFLLIFVPLSPAYAQTASSPASVNPTVTQRMDDRMEKVQDRIETKRENVNERLDAKKERITTRIEERKERFATKSAALKERLQLFKDQTKAERVERINNRLEMINENAITSMTKRLNTLSEILTKLEQRVTAAASTTGKDITAAQAAITSAKTAIETAKAAVETQGGNEYVIVVSDETTVKVDAQTARDNLHEDLKSVNELIKMAKDAVVNAIRISVAAFATGE